MAINQTDKLVVENDEFSTEAISARPAQATSTAVQSGWLAAEKLSAPTREYPTEFKFSETLQVVKFLDEDGPFAVYKLHFLTQKTEGQRSYISLGANDPLCTKLGSKPEEKRAFSIINLSHPDGPKRQMLIASNRLFKSLHAAHFSPQGPLTKNFWALSRTGKMQTTTYHINPVKGRDLMEDWNIDEVAADAAVAAATPFVKSDLKEPTWEELEAVAASLKPAF
jgi:hypothetical protein